jgi:hypothetical protein
VAALDQEGKKLTGLGVRALDALLRRFFLSI